MFARPRAAGDRWWDLARDAVVVAAAAVAITYARPYADSFSDGSRLAAIESVGARGTLRIDDSVFARGPAPGRPPAYNPASPHFANGTSDKMHVGGHFYSHHPPIPLLAGGALYRLWLLAGGPVAADRPDLFCRGMTVLTAGLPFALAVGLLARLTRRTLGLSAADACLVTASFAGATMAAAYTRHVQAHILFLPVAAAACGAVAGAENRGACSGRRAAWLGTLGGAGYCLDGAIGPALLVAVGVYALVRGGWRAAAAAVAAAVPWVAAHHAVLYATTGNAVSPASDPNNFRWPGSPFVPDNLTGNAIKHDAEGAVEYGWVLLFGPRGFFWFNLPLFYAAAGAVALAARLRADRPAVLFAAGWSALGFLPYALGSNNAGGVCLSIRWFLPLLAPGFWVAALALRRFPRTRPGFAWLSACGAVLAAEMLDAGPWSLAPLPSGAVAGAAALAGWGAAGVLTAAAPPGSVAYTPR